MKKVKRLSLLPTIRVLLKMNLMSVSYTHLDVYKRQIMNNSVTDWIMSDGAMHFGVYGKQLSLIHI